MSGFWTLKLGKSKQKEDSRPENNGEADLSDSGSYKLVHSLMERVLTDAEELIETIRQKAEKEARGADFSTVPTPHPVTETTEQPEPQDSTEPEPLTIGTAAPANGSDAPAESSSFIAPDLDRHTLYSDDVELAINAPIEPAAVSKLYNNLQMTPEIKIMYSSGSWDKGTVISVSLEKPLPLLEIISGIPGLNVNIVKSKSGNGTGKTAGTVFGSDKIKVPRLELQISSR